MSHQTILPDGWVMPKGYSNGILAEKGRVLFMAGQVGWDENEKFQHKMRSSMVDMLTRQFDQSLKNVLTVLKKAGGKPEHICRLTCFCTDKDLYLASRKELGEIWKKRMGRHYPAMSMIFVCDLLDSPAMIEIEATAVIPE